MASDDDTADRVLDAAEAAGEDVWQLPIPKHIRGEAGLQGGRHPLHRRRPDGGALVAAAFLREFVGEGIAWAHLDIAGPAWTDGGGSGYISRGGTGFGVRTLVALARSLED